MIPTVLSTGGMIGVRAVMSKSASSSGMGGMMWMMTAATGVMTLVTSTYNYFKQGATNTKKKTEWKENYEKYIKRLIDEKIGIWQKADLTYLQSLYPDMLKLFTQLSTLDSAIFSRSQNDNDFMRITLGVSEHVKPLFDIKYEKKMRFFLMFIIIYGTKHALIAKTREQLIRESQGSIFLHLKVNYRGMHL